MTSQARDFDADLDFDRFGMTGFFEAGVLRTCLIMSSSFSGFSDIGFALAILPHILILVDRIISRNSY